MKARFKRDFSYPWIWAPVMAFLIVIVLYIFWGHAKLWNLFVFVGFIYPLAANFLPYQLTDNDTLIGNSIVNVAVIYKLEKKEKGVKVYYRGALNRVEVDRFYAVKDKNYFIVTLQKINPNIKLN